MDEKNNVKAISNLIWRFAERCGAQGVSFIVSIILARLLEPNVYGTIALITVITTILQVFVDSGMGNALIQKKDADDLDFSSVFYFNFVVCLVLYAGMFAVAPFIADFYEMSELTSLIRVVSLTVVISGVKNVQQAYVSRQLLFKRFFFATLGGTIISAFLGIWMANKGMGAWALVAQQLSNAAIDTMILWITVKWHPKLMFSMARLKGLFNYGWKLLISSLLDTVYTNIRQLIIGKLYSSADLAYYNRGRQIPNLVVTNINTSIDSVLLPVMSKEQDDKERVRSMTRRSIITSTYIMAPMMMGLAFMATPVIRLLLTDKWISSVPFLRIFCITFMFYPIHTANLNAIKAMGRSDMFLKLEIIKKIVGVIVLVSTMWFGVMAMAYSLLLMSIVNQIINSYPNKKLLDYSYATQFKDILPGIALAVIMGFCILPLQILPLPTLMVVILQIVVGAGFYIGVSVLFKMEAFVYLWGVAKPYLSRFKKGKE